MANPALRGRIDVAIPFDAKDPKSVIGAYDKMEAIAADVKASGVAIIGTDTKLGSMPRAKPSDGGADGEKGSPAKPAK